MTILITGQQYLDADVVAAKVAAGDFEVSVSPPFEYDGATYQVILDGNHSYAAAIEAGVKPELVEATASSDDRVGLLVAGKIEDFLMATDAGEGGFIDAGTRALIW